MKKTVFTLIITAFAISVPAQNLLDIYKSGTVRLIPDTEYARSNDWDRIFETYYDTIYKAWMGDRKSLVLMPDGSVVVNHRYRNFYSKFDPDGRFQREFGITGRDGKRFAKTNQIVGVLGGNTFITGLDNMGNMFCFDLNGNYKKTLKLDYAARQFVALPGNKIALVGWVLWTRQIRDFVAIVDYETNHQDIIWDHFTDRGIRRQSSEQGATTGEHQLFIYRYSIGDSIHLEFSTMPFPNEVTRSSPPTIAYTNNSLVVAKPTTGEIWAYDLEGNLKSTDKIDWGLNYVSVDEQKEIQQKAIDRYRSRIDSMIYIPRISKEETRRMMEPLIAEMEADLGKITEPLPLPYFSTMIQDSDGNLLFFEYPREENTNSFNVWVYEVSGRFVCRSSFVCDDYDLEITPSKMVYHNGYIYGLQLLKEASGIPLRLVRFKVTNG